MRAAFYFIFPFLVFLGISWKAGWLQVSRIPETSFGVLVSASIDWDKQNELPPWLTNIEEGAEQAVGMVLGQSLNPDGSVSQILVDRAIKAKELLDAGKVSKLIASGGDPAGVGHTEAASIAQVLIQHGIPADKIIQESQASTTAENAWFSLRWIPKGTGQVYIITSDFHMARATYTITTTFNHYYKMLEDQYRDDPLWKSTTKKYPRLKVVQATAKSFCGSQAPAPAPGINMQPLAERARDELKFLGTGEVVEGFFGPPRNHINKVMYVWPIQIDVNKDPENEANFRRAMAQAMNSAKDLCVCAATPEGGGPATKPYPLPIPVPDTFPDGMNASDWKKICPAILV